jgi:hypothetical protein
VAAISVARSRAKAAYRNAYAEHLISLKIGKAGVEGGRGVKNATDHKILLRLKARRMGTVFTFRG